MDPIALAASAISATMVSALLFLLPGAALGPILLPGASTPLNRLGRAAGVSLLVTFLLCSLLARFGALTGGAVAASLVAISVLGLLVTRPRFRTPGRRRRRWWLGALGGLALVGLLVVGPSLAGAGPDLLPRSSTTWYYANLAQEIASSGTIPTELPEWGASRPFQSDYLPITAQTAAALLLLPGDLLADLEVYRVATLALALLCAALLFRRWVSSWPALLGAILLLGTVRLEQKFDGYRPETMALALALFVLWVADRAVVERSARACAIALVGAILVFLAHAEVFLVLAPALVGIGVGRALVAPGRTGGLLGLRRRFGREQLAAPIIAAALVGGGLVGGTLLGWALAGESRAVAYVLATEAEVEIPAPRADEIPAGWTFTGDPTWDFYVASVAPGLEGQPPPDAFTDTLMLPRSMLHVWDGLDGRFRSGLAVLGGLALVPAIAWSFLDGRRRRFALSWAVFAVLLAAGCLILYLVSDTYVPQRTPGRRLMPYLLFVPVVAATLGLWVLGRLIAPGWRELLPGRGRVVAAGLALALLTAGAVSAAPLPDRPGEEGDAALSRTGYEAYAWMATNLPPDARILANAYTDGSIAAVTGRVGIVDGRAVYLENREFLAASTALCLGARVVFADPSSSGARSFLDRERVTHLVVATTGPTGLDLGGYLLFETDVSALRASPDVSLIRDFGNARLLLFEIGPPSARDAAVMTHAARAIQ